MYDPYEDQELMEWLSKASREALEQEFIELVHNFERIRVELKELRLKLGWERLVRQREGM